MSVEIRRGAILSRYRLEKLVGGGGSAAVWLSFDVDTNEQVALKILRPDLLHDPRSKMRALREASLLSTLIHPNLAHCRKADLEADPPYLVMDYVEGRTLAAVMSGIKSQGNRLELAFAVSVLGQIAAAVDYAHQAGVVHRDLKPANVMVSGNLKDPQATLLDLGVAKILAPDADDPTTLGRLLGTFAYMSPEQAKGEAIDGRSDLFSLGTILFEMLTLRRPWIYDSSGELQSYGDSVHASANPPAQVMRRIDGSPRPNISEYREGLPKALDAIVAKALAVLPADRYATATELARAVWGTLNGQGIELADPTMVTPAPRSETPLYQTVQVPAPTAATAIVDFKRPSPSVVITPPASPLRLVMLLAVVGITTSVGGWWLGLRMGAARRDLAPPPAIVETSPPPAPGVEARPFIDAPPPPAPPPPSEGKAQPKPAKATRPASDAPKVPSELRTLLADVESNDGAIDRQRALAEAIERAAKGIKDTDRQSRIVRTARSSAMVGDVQGLRQAVADLEGALREQR